MSPISTLALRLSCAAALASASLAQTKLLRFPDVHQERVVFCHGGDLWSASTRGGPAVRLTAHPGLELFPKFSPDGAWIAFTGQYDGDEQVYVMPSTGGQPRQLTYYPARGPLPQRWGFDNQVYGWTRDGARVLFRSMREGWDLTDTRLYTVGLSGDMPRALDVPVAGGGDLSPDESKLVYSPLTRDFRTWKRYQGGWAQDLFVFDFATRSLTPVAHHVRTERDPMWIGDRIYFASDRDGTLNLYAFDTRNRLLEQVTTSKTWDVRWPSKGEAGQIVFEFGGELALLDTRTKEQRTISIQVPDDGLNTRAGMVSAAERIEEIGLSPKGERALFSARGEVFSAPIEHGAVRNLTRSPDAHDRSADWSSDGKQVAFLSDKSGEEEIWLVPQDGSAPARQLTRGSDQRRFGLRFSPDSKWIAFAEKSGWIRLASAETGELVDVARDLSGRASDYTWSADSRWLTFSLTRENGYRQLAIWNLEQRKLHTLGSELFNAQEPIFDPSGKYLYFLSDREFAPQLSGLEWNYASARATGIFALALKRDTPHPYPPRSDEVALEGAAAEGGDKGQAKAGEGLGEASKEEGQTKAEKSAPKPVEIEFDGLAERVCPVPVPADNLRNLSANAGHLLYLVSGAGYYGRDSERPTKLMVFGHEKREAEVLAEDVGGYALSSDGSRVLVAKQGKYVRLEAKLGGKDSGKEVATSGLECWRDPTQEFRQIFDEVWRRYRDYFYVPNMHGYDWGALRAQYAGLLEHVSHRADLNYVMGEMVAELNVGHAYVSGGEWQSPKRAGVALLGARLRADEAAGRYQIERILPGQNEEERYRSPLREVGVDAREGDWLLAIDGENLTSADNPYRMLRHKADRTVELTLSANPDGTQPRKVKLRPRSSETDLNYLDWVLKNRERVERLSGGRLGYIHVPDMGEDGIREFIKWYYGQVRKEGLIVDDRNNGGGNVSQMLIERLRRTLLGTGFARNSEYTETYPSVVFTGPMVCLLNENSASDGDIFPWMFRQAGLGKLIGKRSWGGVVGISDHGPLMDGGTCSVPEFGNNAADGSWAVEGQGVDPDIVVENDATSILAGRDPQLEKAVEVLLEELKTRSAALPRAPAPPVKTR
jgi:tricorn protease